MKIISVDHQKFLRMIWKIFLTLLIFMVHGFVKRINICIRNKESKGKVGYVLNKPVPASSVHPSKRPRISPVLHEPGTSSHDIELPSDTSDTESSITDSLSDTETSKRKKP